MAIKDLNYTIRYTKGSDCILISPQNWEGNTSNLIRGYSIDGSSAMNYLTRALKLNIDSEVFGTPLVENDLVLLTKVATRVGYLRPFKIPVNRNNTKYANVHIMQVIGKFTNATIDLHNLVPLFDKVVMERVEVKASSFICTSSEDTSVGKVVKVGDGGFTSKWKRRPMEISAGEYVLLRDNITTSISLSGQDYICTEDSMVVGKFKDENFDINNLEVLHEGIILEERQEEMVAGSGLLLNPPIDLEYDDISEAYLRDRFAVINKSNKVKDVEIGDTIVICRDSTNYITLKGKKYFYINGIRDIEGIIKK